MQSAASQQQRLHARITELIDSIVHACTSGVQEPRVAVTALLDALIRELRLDFACARLSDAFDLPPTDLIRLPRHRTEDARGAELAAAFQRCLETTGPRWPFVVSNPLGNGHVSIAVLPLGNAERFGRIVAGSGRADFPTRSERHALEYAVSEAAARLQEGVWIAAAAQTPEGGACGQTPEPLSMEQQDGPQPQDAAGGGSAPAPVVHAASALGDGQLTGSSAADSDVAVAALAADEHAPLPWLDEEPADVHAANAALERIIRRSSPVTEVVSHIRAFLTRGETRRVPLQLLDVIEDALGVVQDVAREHQITLRVEPALKLPPVMGERIQLQQLVVNLVLNGIEAMFDTPRNRRALVIHARKHGTDAVLVRMRDSGKGLEPQERKRVFDPFYTTKPEGLGMGLAISRTIVEAHGGRLWASANDDCGETFQFTLPIAPAHHRAAG